MSLNIVAVSGSEAWENNMHPIPFHLDKTGAAMIVERFPEEGIYLKLRRPPRASLMFLASAYQSDTHNRHTLLSAIESTFNETKQKPIRFGKNRTIELGLLSRIAVEFTTGKGISRKKWIGALVPSPDGGPYGLLVVFGIYIGSSKKATKSDVLKNPVLQQLLQSFKLGIPEV